MQASPSASSVTWQKPVAQTQQASMMDASSRSFMKRSASASLLASPTHELTFTSKSQSSSESMERTAMSRTLSPQLWKQRPPVQPALSVTQFYQTPFETAYNELAKQRNLRRLEALFVEADVDGSGEMSLTEFSEALRKPRFQRTFSALGVQPHQSELVFMSMLKRSKGYDLRTCSGGGELSIHHFMEGLTQLVGASPDGTGKELDIAMLKPTREAKLRRQGVSGTADAASPSAASSAAQDGSVSPSQQGGRHHPGAVGLGLGPVHLLPEVTIHRAFVHSATAKALQPPTSSKRTARSHASP